MSKATTIVLAMSLLASGSAYAAEPGHEGRAAISAPNPNSSLGAAPGTNLGPSTSQSLGAAPGTSLGTNGAAGSSLGAAPGTALGSHP